MGKDTIFTVIDRDGEFYCYIIIKNIEPQRKLARLIRWKYNYALKHGKEDFSDFFEDEVKKITGYENTHFVYSDMRYVVGGG
ncbi:MAG: hypothetical protein J6J60_04120 [Clostridia bacterium]|nr:hypothetical protein [Clostridia bacterium]MBP3596569.1 hypothetical protein [Clostridia bacterium]